MPNQFVSIKQIARETLPRLIGNLVFPKLISNDFSEAYSQKLGDKIQVRKPVILQANEFNPSAGVTAQDTKEESIEVALDKIATVDIEISALEGATSINDLNRIFIEPAAVALAEKINSDGLNLYKDIPFVYGTAGTTPGAKTDFTSARKILNKNKVPTMPRNAVWDPDAEAKFLELDAFSDADKSGSTQALRDGAIGKLYGFNNYMAQDVKKHTKGTLSVTGTSASLVVKTDIAAESDAVVLKNSATAGTPTISGTLVAGDIISIDGKSYTVKENSNVAAATSDITVKVYPNILSATANTAVTVAGTHIANLCFHPSAFTFVTRPLSTPSGVESYVTNYEGISLRVVRGYNMQYKKETLSMDVLYGYKTMYPELAVRVLG